MPSREFKLKKQWLSHPLFLLLLGAIITSLLFPYLTNKLQVNEKELDVKFNLAEEVSDTVNTYLMKTVRYSNLNYNSTKSLDTLMTSIVEDAIRGIESCASTRQHLILYFPQNSDLIEQLDNVCTSLAFYYMYSVLPREIDRNGLFANLSKTMMELADKRLDLDLSDVQLENLSEEENRTRYVKDIRIVHNTIINKTQDLMQNIISSDLVGY